MLIKALHHRMKEVKEALLHLAFPHICEGCGSDIIGTDHYLCIRCLHAMPETRFHLYSDNPVEKMFWGRIPLLHATAQYYFTKESLMQRLVHRFKYRADQELGHYLGTLAGEALQAAPRFTAIDAIIPLPLHRAKEKRRGFNQATVLSKGMAQVLQKPVLEQVVRRPEHTQTQTRKNRVERWENMEGRFELMNSNAIAGKHVLLVDDVITTGATLEACSHALLCAGGIKLSIATLCISSGN